MENMSCDLYEKINNIFDDFSVVDFSWTQYLNDLENFRKKAKPSKQDVESKPWELCIDSNITDDIEGRFFSDIGTAHFEGFLKRGSEKKLYVMFGGSRSRDGGKYIADIPTFARWSWYNCTAASYLCLEDPMFYTYDECILGWFYGTKDEDYREYAARLIKKIAAKLDVEVENIILYGSSGGGTAAIGTAKYLKGCCVVGINPQLDLAEFHLNLSEENYAEELERIIGIDIVNGIDIFGRNNNYELINNNTETKFLFIVNVRSEQDFQHQFAYLCKRKNIEPRYGVEEHGNIWTWVYDAYGAPNVHTSYENETIHKMIDVLIDCMKADVKIEEIKSIYRFVNEIWFERYVLKKEMYDCNTKLKQTYDEKSELNRKLQQTYGEKSDLNTKLKQTYDEKSEINRKLQQTYDEKSELNRKLQQTYDEKYERGIQIQNLKKENIKLQSELNDVTKQLSNLQNKLLIKLYLNVKQKVKKMIKKKI